MRVVNKHRSACLHSALAHRGTKLHKTTGEDIDTKTLDMRERERERGREMEREGGGE